MDDSATTWICVGCLLDLLHRGQVMKSGKPVVDRMVEEGILDAELLSEEQKKLINEKVTEEEIQALISLKEKLTIFHWPIKPMIF